MTSQTAKTYYTNIGIISTLKDLHQARHTSIPTTATLCLSNVNTTMVIGTGHRYTTCIKFTYPGVMQVSIKYIMDAVHL